MKRTPEELAAAGPGACNFTDRFRKPKDLPQAMSDTQSKTPKCDAEEFEVENCVGARFVVPSELAREFEEANGRLRLALEKAFRDLGTLYLRHQDDTAFRSGEEVRAALAQIGGGE